MALTTQFKRYFITILQQSDLELIFAIIRRYGIGGGIPPEVTSIDNLLFDKEYGRYEINVTEPVKCVSADSSQIKKLIAWLESTYSEPTKVDGDNLQASIDEDGFIKINKDRFTKAQLKALVVEIDKV